MKSAITVFLLYLLLASPLSTAHHSSARYDMTRQITVEGTLDRLVWANPHVYLYVTEVTGGNTVTWEIENHPPAMMRRMGWTKDTLREGDRISVSGSPARNDSTPGIYPTAIDKNGVSLFRAGDFTALSNPTVIPESGTDTLAGVWETMVSLPLILAFYNPDHALTAAGEAALQSYNETTMLPGLDCIPYSSPLLMFDPDFKQITLGNDLIEISSGYAGTVRSIHMDTDSHAGAAASIQGHSIGRWEDDTLVIDTAHFSDHRTANGYRGIPSGAQKHLVERLTLDEDGKSLLYSFELTDPQYLAGPVTGEVRWGYRPDVTYAYETCTLENARRFLNE
jgi:hypothetical protein